MSPPILFINLDRATARRRFMETQAARLGLPMERVAAVDAARVDGRTAARLGRTWERPLTAPELGCFLSHHALWERVAAAGRPCAVLEDDVILSRRIPAALPILSEIAGADFLNLETYDRRRFVARQARALAPGLAVRRVFRDKSGSGAYLLWPAGAERLLRRAERGAAPVDAFLHGLAGLTAFQSEPALAIQAHLAVARGWKLSIDPATSIQAPRDRLSLSFANLPFHARRLAAQVRLAGQHLRRLGPAVYRRVEVDAADFV